MHSTRRALLFYGVGSVNVLSALLPIWPGRFLLLEHLLHLPLPLILGAQHVTLCAGVAMLLLAYPAAHGHRRAAYLLMLCAGLAIVSNVVKGFDLEEALLDGIVLVALWRGRRALVTIPVRYTPLDVARLAVLLLIIGRLYALLGAAVLGGLRALVHDEVHEMPFFGHLQFLLTTKLTLQSLWFHQSQVLLPLFLVAIFVLISWTSLVHGQGHAERAREVYERFGRASHNSLAYVARRGDAAVFVDAAGRGAITYRQVGRVALQIGAILAPGAAQTEVYAAFRDFCRARRLIPAAAALAQDERPIARGASMHTFAVGTEAMVDLGAFAVERLSKKMRWARRSLAKRGYVVELLAAPAITPHQRAALRKIDLEWRHSRGGQDHGCCMTLGRFPTRDDPECLIGLVNDADGVPVAYLTLLPGGNGCYSLDLTRRRSSAPNAAMEFLIMETLLQLQARGAATVSLNFSTGSWLRALPGGERVRALFGAAFQLHSLEAFNNKFRPAWVPRYMAFPSWYVLPDVVYAILAVEGADRMVINACARAIRHRVGPLRAAALLPSGPEPRLHGENA